MQNDKYVKIRKHTQVLYQKVEHTNFYVNIPKIFIYIEDLVFLGFRDSREFK